VAANLFLEKSVPALFFCELSRRQFYDQEAPVEVLEVRLVLSSNIWNQYFLPSKTSSPFFGPSQKSLYHRNSSRLRSSSGRLRYWLFSFASLKVDTHLLPN